MVASFSDCLLTPLSEERKREPGNMVALFSDCLLTPLSEERKREPGNMVASFSDCLLTCSSLICFLDKDKMYVRLGKCAKTAVGGGTCVMYIV